MGDLESVKEYLNSGGNINLSGWSLNNSLLNMSIISDKIDIAEFLVRNGADVNLPNKMGKTALILAAERGYDLLVSLILEFGGLINLQDKEGETALSSAILHDQVSTVKNLVDKGADLNTKWEMIQLLYLHLVRVILK